ncbi:MAG: DUF3489 domain-containing protein [Pseudomonadota bacterium]|nr:DUF3489 domain-containing protein [Pseudomonadota bacterium]MDE3037366.1 DUF3489 domain-containing protein [Pseudomonadota bacterium]
MTKLSDSQRSILKAASKQPKTDVRKFMIHIKSPPIRDKVVTAMLNNGLVVEDPDAEGVVYVISDAGFEAIGKKKPEAPEENAAEEKEPAAPEPEAKAPAKKQEPKPKREGTSKKQTMIDMLSRDEGATIKQLMDSIGWQKHSVHGAMANLKKELQEKRGQTITGTKGDGEDRVYKIA